MFVSVDGHLRRNPQRLHCLVHQVDEAGRFFTEALERTTGQAAFKDSGSGFLI